MARATRAARGTRGKKASGVSVDLSNIGKAFEPGQEYAIKCIECTLEEGSKAPYFNLKLAGLAEDYETSYMYHRASTSESSLWRLRPLLEAFGIEIPDGPFDITPDMFIDKEAMCSTFLDRYEGGSSVKPEDFWPLDGDGSDGDADGDAGDFDLDELDDEQIEALAEALDVTGKTTALKKKKLAKMDQEEVAAAFAELEGDGDGEELDIDALDDDDIEALADHLEVKGKSIALKKKALKKLDLADVQEAYDELELGDAAPEEPEPKATGKAGKAGKAGKKAAVTEEEVQEMNEDELEALIEEQELDVDLSEFKTLRKKKNAVVDAMEEAGKF